MNDTIKNAAKRLLSNRLFSFGAIVILALLLTGLLSASPSINEVNAVAAPVAKKPTPIPMLTVTVAVDGETKTVTIENGTVADALNAAGITLGEDDTVEPAETVELKDNMAVTVTRIAFVERVETEAVPFESVEENASDLLEGKKELKQEGVDGVRERVFCDKVVDGTVQSTTELRSSITKKPVNEIWRVGTKKPVAVTAPAGVITDVNGVPTNYTSCLTGEATAYTNDRGLAGDWTASGLPAQVGVVAVNPDIIPLGTHLYIVSTDGKYVYGYAIAGDTGGALYSGAALVDLFYDTYEECIQFGRRNVNIYVLD